jgi:hypothetical protein
VSGGPTLQDRPTKDRETMESRVSGAKAYAASAVAGFAAGLATIVASFAVLFLIGLIPSRSPWTFFAFFGSGGHGPLIGRVQSAVLAPFNGATHTIWRQAGFDGQETSLRTGAAFGGMLVLFAVLCLVGRELRRRLPLSLRLRTLALAVASLTVAGGTAAIALLDLTFQAAGFSVHVHQAAGSQFSAALLLMLLLGVFTFGVVNLLPRPFSSVLRRAGAFVGIAFIVAGTLLPVFVVSDGLPGAHVFEDMGNTSAFSASFGGFAVPLALEAPVAVGQLNGSPFFSNQSPSVGWHWADLISPVFAYSPAARHFRIATSYGAWGWVVGAGIALAILVALALTTVRLCRRAGVATAAGDLWLGMLLGGGIALLVTLARFVTSHSLGFGGAASTGRADLWRATWWGLAQTAVTLIVFCAAVGVVHGLLKRRQARTTESMSASCDTVAP